MAPGAWPVMRLAAPGRWKGRAVWAGDAGDAGSKVLAWPERFGEKAARQRVGAWGFYPHLGDCG